MKIGLTTERQPRVTTRFGKRQRIREEEKEREKKRTKPVNLGDNALSYFMLDKQRGRGEVVGWEGKEEEEMDGCVKQGTNNFPLQFILTTWAF